MAASNAESFGAVDIFGYTVDFLQELGRGGFGTVYRGHNKHKDIIAIKKVAINDENEDDRKKAIAEAVKFHFLKENVCNDHVIKVYDVKRWKDSMWIMMEFCDLGDLNKFFIKHHQKIDTKTKVQIMWQISKGVSFLHRQNIVHRDIKPGNILVKNGNSYAIVKLGDFGLSKFLDPDDITSAMSSNVGTLAFKAPEFWDRKPNDRIRYHRNVDVYAAGLTFTAMLQAKPGHNLVPKAEDSLQSFETKMSIGLAAFTRCQSKHNEIKVVVPDNNDDATPANKLKLIIEAMTYFSPEARIAAEEVQLRIDALATELAGKDVAIIPTSHFRIGKFSYTNELCYLNSHVVLNGCLSPEPGNETIRVYNETGNMLKEWKSCCVLCSVFKFQIQGKDHLLEACQFCKIIQSYEIPDIRLHGRTILPKNISPSIFSEGPDSTILAFDKKQKSILQFRYSKAQFHLADEFSVAFEDVLSMCFSGHCGIVTVLHSDRKTMTGVYLATGQVVWKKSGPPPNDLDHLEDVFTFPDGRVGVFNFRSLYALDPKDGTVLHALFYLHGRGTIWAMASCYSENQQKLVIHNGTPEQTQISVYQACHYIKMEDLKLEETNVKTNDFT